LKIGNSKIIFISDSSVEIEIAKILKIQSTLFIILCFNHAFQALFC